MDGSLVNFSDKKLPTERVLFEILLKKFREFATGGTCMAELNFHVHIFALVKLQKDRPVFKQFILKEGTV